MRAPPRSQLDRQGLPAVRSTHSRLAVPDLGHPLPHRGGQGNLALVGQENDIHAVFLHVGHPQMLGGLDVQQSPTRAADLCEIVCLRRKFTGIDLLEWVVDAEKRGAGEILLTSMDADGTKVGFDLPMLQKVTEAVHIPVIASGGCGSLAHFAEVFEKTDADAALAASLFHFGELTVGQVKEYLHGKNIPVRL